MGANSGDKYTVTSMTGYGGRIRQSAPKIIIGVLLIVLSAVLLFKNEGCVINNKRTMETGKKLVVSVSAGSVNPANEDKLIHITGQLSSLPMLKDSYFGISREAVALNRIVEVYQWAEHKETKSKVNMGGSEDTTATYIYTKEWSSRLINSDNFN